jgi:multicomponent Na+:H+ antiporter subunit D
MMSDIIAHIPPAIIMLVASLLIPFLKEEIRRPFVLIIPLITLAQIWQIPVGEGMLITHIAGFTVSPLYAHEYTHIFATIFCIAAFAGSLFGLYQSKPLEMSAAFLYAASAIGVTFSGDYITMFIYWELMAIGSTLVIFASDNKFAMRAGVRYAMVHFLGGIVFMAGIIANIMYNGTVEVTAIDTNLLSVQSGAALDTNYVLSVILILLGVLINAGAPPLSAWLTDAYPRSSAFGAVFLSAYTTKTSVFVLITLFAGLDLLIYVGLFMVFYGIVYAMLENDMRKILSYSIINQVGFMVVGIGIGTDFALNGAATHAFAHIIYKALLFMSAGSVLYMTGKSKCTELGGLYKTMPITATCGIIGALAISAFPLTSGFVTKSMITSAAMYENLEFVWLMLMAASAGVFLHAGIKFPWFVFFQTDSGMRPKEPPMNMRLAMLLLSALCIIPAIPSVAEHTIYRLLPTMPVYQSYTAEHVISQIQILLFSAFAFFVCLGMLKRTDTISLDFDWFYRRLGYYICSVIYYIARFPIRVGRIVLKKLFVHAIRIVRITHSPEGVMARRWPLSTTVMWIGFLLGVYMIVYFCS